MMGRIQILTGAIQTGKTSLCQELVTLARKTGITPGGLLSPAVFRDGKKVAIDVLDITSDQRRRLAESKVDQTSQLSTNRWTFDPEVVQWGNHQLLHSVPCDLLLIDELGPLEFYQGEGWVNAFNILQEGKFSSALVVIRPSLIPEASLRWKVTRIVNLSDPDTSIPPVNFLLDQLIDR